MGGLGIWKRGKRGSAESMVLVSFLRFRLARFATVIKSYSHRPGCRNESFAQVFLGLLEQGRKNIIGS